MSKLPRPAQYLLRVDDLCPTVAAEPWRRMVALIEEFRLQPILGVVPENRDPELEQGLADPGFWEQMRILEANGAAIGLHGFRHLCGSSGCGLLRLAERSEFAGVAEQVQREWIREGLRILRGQGLTPKIWVAPRHGFDVFTLRVLQEEGVDVLSDGLTRGPFLRGGLTWIPQQLWAPVEKSKGLWTICVHPNTASEVEIGALHAFLLGHGDRFTSVDRARAEFPAGRLSLSEEMYARLALWRLQVRRRLNRTVR